MGIYDLETLTGATGDALVLLENENPEIFGKANRRLEVEKALGYQANNVGTDYMNATYHSERAKWAFDNIGNKILDPDYGQDGVAYNPKVPIDPYYKAGPKAPMFDFTDCGDEIDLTCLIKKAKFEAKTAYEVAEAAYNAALAFEALLQPKPMDAPVRTSSKTKTSVKLNLD